MAPDRRTLFDAAFGALMIRTALPQPPRRPASDGAEQNPNSLPSNRLASGPEPTGGVS
jgi:hypothetical protein